MQYRHRGFTLIELVLVIVLLGVLAAVAMPKFLDLRSEARLAAAKATYGAVRTAAELNFVSVKLGKPGAIPFNSSGGTTGAEKLAQKVTLGPDWQAVVQVIYNDDYMILVMPEESANAPATVTLYDIGGNTIYMP